MTREQAKEILPIIQAFAEGKTIQVWANDTWQDEEYPCFGELSQFRIKPEPKCRPFKTKEECWNEMMKHQPFGWVKTPEGEFFCIDRVFDEGIAYKHSSCRFDEYLEANYTFIDGSPFGIQIN